MRVGYELRSLGLLAKEKAPVSVYNETKIVVTQRALGKGQGEYREYHTDSP